MPPGGRHDQPWAYFITFTFTAADYMGTSEGRLTVTTTATAGVFSSLIPGEPVSKPG